MRWNYQFIVSFSRGTDEFMIWAHALTPEPSSQTMRCV